MPGLLGGVAILVVLNVANASGWLWSPSVGPYLASVIGQLGSACACFVVAFFSPTDSDEPAV